MITNSEINQLMFIKVKEIAENQSHR